MYNVSIPEISRDELISRYQRIKPIVEINKKKYFLRDFNEDELTNTSYIWHRHTDRRELVDLYLLVARPEFDFEYLHTYGYHGLFKPSIAEVLAQIPELELDFVDAFEIIKSPRNWNDLVRNQIVFDNGFHISKVRLYTSRNNPKVHFID